MEKLTKTFLLVSLLIVLSLFFFGYSETSEIGATVLFPFIFAILFYYIVLNIFSINFENKKYNILMALFIGGIALFSTSIGYHYSSNAINNMILSAGSIPQSELQERIYFMDEYFSHWLMAGGVIIMSIAVIIWADSHYKEVKGKTKKDSRFEKENKIIDNFIIIFVGTSTGVILGLLSISGNVVNKGLVLAAVIITILFWKFKTIAISKRGFELLLYASSTLSSYIALLFSLYFIYRVDYLCSFLYEMF